jgi:hypothetical protein
MELVIEVIKMLVNLLQDSGARPILIVLVVVMFGIVGLVVWGRGEVRLGPVHLNFRRKEVPDEARASGSGDQVGSEEGPGGKLGGMDGGWNKGPLKSQHVVTRVLSRKKAGLLVEGPKIEDASHDAAEFYGYRGDEAKRLHGMTLADLLERLRPFMKPGDFDAFRSDQMRMGNDYNEGKPVMAEIPIVFNGGTPLSGISKAGLLSCDLAFRGRGER